MFEKTIKEIFTEPGITDWIQALSATASLFVAAVAIYLTRISVHAPFRAELRPLDLERKKNEFLKYDLMLYNSGPGVAYNVQVWATALVGIQPDPQPGNTLKVWIKTKQIRAKTKLDLQANTEQKFEFSERLKLQNPFVITWEITNGKKKKTYWIYSINGYGEENFSKMVSYQIIIYRLKAVFVTLFLSPINSIVKRSRFNKYKD